MLTGLHSLQYIDFFYLIIKPTTSFKYPVKGRSFFIDYEQSTVLINLII